MLIVQLRDPAKPQPAVAQVEALLRTRHHLTGSALDDFNLTNPRAVMAQVASLGSTLQRLLLIVAVLATGIGGIVIMSVTLIGVSERRREIGIRRAVGATRASVMLQFLLEAVLLSATGGLAGVGIGIGGTQIVSKWQHLPFLVQQRAVAASVMLSIALGLVFGIYPAWKAARTNPVDALRG
jgi:ABC-type antimicrobial peptide transport system permease subunit